MKNNIAPPNRQAGVIVAPKNTVSEYISSGKSTISLDEALRLFFLYARHEGFINNIDTHKEKELARCAFNFMVILDGACRENKRKTEDLKTFVSALDFLHEVSGINDLVLWFKDVPKRKVHAEESGNARSFKRLYRLTPCSEISQIKTYQQFKQEVLGHRGWFMFTEYAFENWNKEELATIFKGRKDVATAFWNKRRLFLTFILSIHLGTKIRPFSLEEINGLVLELSKDYKMWRGEFNNKLRGLGEKGKTMAEMLLVQPEMRMILENLKAKQNQTVHFFASDVGLQKRDKTVFLNMKSIVTAAASLASKHQFNLFSPVELGDNRDKTQQGIAKANRELSKLHPTRLAMVFSRNPWLIRWLNEENLLRLRMASVGKASSNNQTIERYADKLMLASVDSLLNREFSVGSLMRNLWQIERDDRDTSVRDLLKKDDSWQNSGQLEPWSEAYLKLWITRTLADTLAGWPLEDISQTIIELNNNWGFQIPEKSLTTAQWLGLFLVFGKELPDYVADYIRKESWHRYIASDSARIWISRMINDKTAVSMRKELPGKYKGDIQKIVDSIVGFTIAEL